MNFSRILPLSLALGLVACGGPSYEGASSQSRDAETEAPVETVEETTPPMNETTPNSDESLSEVTPARTSETVTFGAGCFWCIEAVLEQIEGVTDVRSGYMGGKVPNPTYKDVCSGSTGHAEVVEVTFDPRVLSFEGVLDHFWKLHDPTTLNRQGADVGTQYRSAIFYHSDEQKQAAERSSRKYADVFADPIVTEISPASTFYEAENYHQDYYRLNKTQPYCRSVIAPKLKKLGLED